MKVLVVVLCLVACTKPNPNRCCVDEADCAANGIANGSTCDPGLLCRGHQCIAVPCASSSQCDESAPYCVAEACAETCTDDDSCPGFGGAATSGYCVAGACVECRVDVPEDCAGVTPICGAGMCRGCETHDECPLGICTGDGSCASESMIAFAAVGGSTTSDCTRAAPCTLERAVAATPLRPYVAVGPGTHTTVGTLTVSGAFRSIVGVSSTRPVVTRSTQGSIFVVDIGADVTFENLEVRGATGTGAVGIECPTNPNGARTVRVRDVVLANNASGGLFGQLATVHAERTEFRNNGFGAALVDGTGFFNRCIVAGNTGQGLTLDSGIYSVTNSFVFRNGDSGIYLYSTNPGSRFEFNTIVDNQGSGAVYCDASNAPTVHANNIIVRNQVNTTGGTCTFPGSIILPTVSDLRFKSPDASPYDYHLAAGSSAIDQASASTLAHDFDGDARPQGAGRDVGADEYKP